MNELAKAMKVIRLKDEEFGQYLTAGDDKVSVTLTKPDSKRLKPKNTEWRLEWVKEPRGLVGQVRLWSIHNKVLTFAGDPADYCLNNPLYDALTIESWPVSAGAAASEWRFELRRRNDDATLVGDLFKKSKQFGESMNLTAKRPSIDKGSRLEFNSFYRKSLLKWMNFNSWLVEVVVSQDDDPTTKLTTSIGTRAPAKTDTDTCNDDQYNDKSHVSPVSPVSAVSPVSPVMLPVQRQVSSNETRSSKIGSLHDIDIYNDDQYRYQHNKSVVSPDTKLITSNNVTGSSSYIGSIRDQFMSTLSRWQVGQVYLNVTPTSTGGVHTSAGYNWARYYNSGGNVNGSGIQKNGDVSVSSEINRSRDNNANFVNYK